jgi:hypothetical protein
MIIKLTCCRWRFTVINVLPEAQSHSGIDGIAATVDALTTGSPLTPHL